jgi:hypothetical protein
MNKSIYVRVPNDIAHIIGLDNQVEVSFSFEDLGNELRLIYSLDKSKPEHETPAITASAVDTNPVTTKPVIRGLRTSEGGGHGTQVETQELPEE